ncbi:MAG: hypothetical protein J2P20_15435 [Pseudonocardia sp.]|nr:hypothetical protein [Pseudonocardia sp.]MBO0872076.1 hypothetical protein [Pseudonocardia sp.]
MARTDTAGYAELNALLDQARDPNRRPPEATDRQLLGLQQRWATALSARLDAAIEFTAQRHLVDEAADAWRELAARHRTLRAVLDSYEDRSSALADAQRAEFRMLALAAGLSGLDEPVEDVVRLGRGFRDLIRDTGGHRPGSAPTPAGRLSTTRSWSRSDSTHTHRGTFTPDPHRAA